MNKVDGINSFLLLWFFLALLGHFLAQWFSPPIRPWGLLILSLLFYLYISPYFIGILFYLGTICYYSGNFISPPTCRVSYPASYSRRKFNLFITLILLFVPLLIFKYLRNYSNYYSNSVPLGISFYTFQSISFAVDSYRKAKNHPQSFHHILLYLSFFPKILAGPLEKPDVFFSQLNKNNLNYDDLRSGIWLITLGLFKKKILADPLFSLVDNILRNPQQSGFYLLLCILVLGRYQIFFDFSGYTDIARGTSRIMGIELSENFQSPFRVTNIADYWRRWHITLSRWMKEYVFFPLALQCKRKSHLGLIIIFCFVLLGLWHGAEMHFIFYGAIQGMSVTLYFLFKPFFEHIQKTLPNKIYYYLFQLMSWCFTFFVLICGPVALFWLKDMDMISVYYHHILHQFFHVNWQQSLSIELKSQLIKFIIFITIFEMGQFINSTFSLKNWLENQPTLMRWAIYWLVGMLFFLFHELKPTTLFSYSQF